MRRLRRYSRESAGSTFCSQLFHPRRSPAAAERLRSGVEFELVRGLLSAAVLKVHSVQ